jgi:hypothetical protein
VQHCSAGNVAHAVVADIKTFDDAEAERPRLLNDTTTHFKLRLR